VSTYIEGLKIWAAARRSAAAAERAHNARPLDKKIHDWYAALPAQQRRTLYTMDELVLLFNAAPGRIGTALHRLGWQRGRHWRAGESYGRYWVPSP
jgi:hypothetical protein